MTTTESALAPATDASDEPAVRATGLTRTFGQVRALDAVDLTVPTGSFAVLLGPSGSGKSTLLRALAGIDRIDSGVVELAGRRVDGPGRFVPPERRDLAMVFQDYALWPHLDVEHNVAFALRRRPLDGTAKRRAALEMLDRVGLGGKAARYPDELSGGQQQRVALARALVGRPQLVLFDEPLSNLDADLRERLRVQIATLTAEAGASAVYITHDQTEAFALADHLVVLDAGRVVQRGAPEQIYHHPASPFVARFTGLAGSVKGTVTSIEGDAVHVAVPGAVLRAVASALTVGVDVEVLIRPTAVAFAAEGSDGGIPGVIVDRAYRGLGYDHVVETSIGLLSGVRHVAARDRGGRCTVSITAAGCFAYPVSLER